MTNYRSMKMNRTGAAGQQTRRHNPFTLKAVTATLGAVAICLSAAAGAYAGGADEKSPYGGQVTVPVLNRIEGLHPLLDRSVENVVQQFLFNGLVAFDESVAPIPDLAESWTVSDDGLQWDFSLRRDVLFHDGEPLTSDDVVFTLNEILANPLEYSMSPLFGNIATVTAPDEYAVRVTLRQPYAPLLHLLTVDILPRHLLTDGVGIERFRKKPVGTGPFAFSSWEGELITLEANEEFFRGRPYLDSVLIKYLHDKTAAWSELMQGKVSIVTDLDPEDYRVIESDPRFETYSYLDVFYYTILLNNENPLFSDRDVRLAIALALDKKTIIEESLSGWGDITTGPYIPGTWPYNSDVTAGLYDLEKARSVLAAAGWTDSDGNGVLDRNGEELAFELLIDDGDLLKEAVGRSIKWQLYEAGMRVDVVSLDFQQMLQQRLSPGEYEAALLQFNAAGDPDTFTYLFWHSSRIGSSNLARYGNPVVDELIELGRTEPDLDRRQAAYREIHRVIADEAASAFLFVRRIYMGADSSVEGVKAQPQLFYNSAHEWKIEAQ